MTALLTNNLPLLADAPNGIKKLRELILELAVRGKLVPQDPSDEPVSELLKRIAEEKAPLVVAGKKVKQQAEINDKEQPFSVPQSWSWVRLGSCLEMINGRAFKPTEWIAAGLPIVRIQNLNKPDAPFNYCDPDTVDDRHVIDTGTILISWSGTPGTSFGAFIWERGKAALNQHIFSCFQVGDAFFDKFLKLAINTRLEELIAKAHGGVGLQHVTKGKLEALTLVLPPLAEQHRIVAKVDELMALCDRLEAQQADAESAHAQLVQALLDSLTQASDADEFAANWQRLAEHFHTLFTTEPSIDALKKNLLQLAVMGKLVPQDPSDEPASELLTRVELQNQLTATSSKSKKPKQEIDAASNIALFELPMGWAIARVSQTGEIKLGRQRSPKDHFGEHMVPYLRVANVKENALDLSNVKEMNFTPAEQKIFRLLPGDVLLNEGQSKELVGRPAIFNGEIPGVCFQNTLLRFRAYDCVIPIYALRYFQSCMHSGRFQQAAQQTTNIAHLSASRLAAIEFPLPPVPEQHRIVAKVDQLMALCDQLKTRLTQARQLNVQLASTLVERALADDGQQVPVARDQNAARTLLAAEITHQLHGQRTFGQRKLQKVIYLAEHAARLVAVQGNYLRDAAGPHDRQLMNQVENELCNRQWYECIDRETFGHAYRPLSQAGQHRQAYDSAWSTAERATIKRVVDLMRDWDTDRCEMTVTLYAAWNDFILEGRPVTDEAIVNEVMHRWNDAKLRFGKDEWLAVIAKMKKQEILTPTGFGQRTTGGMLSLPGFE